MIKVGVFGASGYTGFEIIGMLRRHPAVELAFATSESSAGLAISDLYPVPWPIPLVASAKAPLDQVDAVFCCLPHAASMPAVVAARQAGVRVIDLSADFRLDDVAVYKKFYGVPHTAPDLLAEAVYGVPEIYRDQIRSTNLLACPGCYPTSVLLGLYPLLKATLLNPAAFIIADSKTGVSGAGRKATLKTHFVEANENLSPYNLGQSHRHTAEMIQEINKLGGPGNNVIFSPHLIPLSRGMLSTIYITLAEDSSAETIHQLFTDTYADEPFIWVLPLGQLATMAHTQRTNRCAISITQVTTRLFIVCSSIDNLLKGASGGAVQNFNIMFGLTETEGLVQ
ncbi:MAG: N-acetyl-gamma-glutamyl-phosphate reductase [Anaerolineae bacterium]|nr:N-acetyl-gamma-glutamyl-phosphate reductase [Anaerolineae bacterium]